MTRGAELARRGPCSPSLEQLVKPLEGKVQGDFARAVSLVHSVGYGRPLSRCQRECRGFESHHPLVLTAVVHKRQRRPSFDVGASYDDHARRSPQPQQTVRLASE